MKPSYRFYRGSYRLAHIFFKVFYFYKVKGRENVPKGAAMICANHSHMKDPVIISLACGIEHFVHYVAKIELFRIPVLRAIITKLGAISVDRDISDVSTIKTCLGYLKNNDKVSIFPEGRRLASADEAAAKNGAVKLAERTGVPIVPVFLPRRKPLFRRISVVIGEPYFIEKQESKRSAEDYNKLAEELMAKIEALGG